jgi:GNAT superfamily N-acetyltransferase
MAGLEVRLAKLADVSQMAEVFAYGFIDDDVFGRWMHPGRHEHPEDWFRWWHVEVRKHVLDPAGKCFVRTNQEGVIMGCMLMKRIGEGARALAQAETYPEMLVRKMYDADEYADSFTGTNRSADPKALEAFEQNWNEIEHHFTGPRAESWMIELLCIHPDAQKSGYGKALIEAAIAVAQSEEPPLPLAVIASEIGDAFYEKIGFREVGRANVGALSEVEGGSLKFYEQHLKT